MVTVAIRRAGCRARRLTFHLCLGSARAGFGDKQTELFLTRARVRIGTREAATTRLVQQ